MLFIRNVLFIGLFAAYPAVVQGNPSYSAELENVRALPYGYTAVCYMPDLKLQSGSSATFVIRDSLLCAVATQHREFKGRAEFVLCSNDPELALPDNKAPLNVPPKCVDLDLSLEALEL